MWLQITAMFILAESVLPAVSPATLGLVIRKGAPVPSVILDHFEMETAVGVERSLKNGSWELAWRDESTYSSSESFDRLIVVMFKGDCTTIMPKSAAASGPLGWTSTSGGRILPFIGIDCDQVKNALTAPDAWPHSIIPSALLARALSHVALHEVYHVLSGRAHHDSEGLFKAEYSPSDLLAPFPHAEVAGFPVRP